MDERPDRDAMMTGPLWASGGFALRVVGPLGRRDVVRVGRPFAVVGRAPGVDVRIDAPGASLRHVYLHLSGRRGLFAVDLASRTGLRMDGAKSRGGWLGVGGVLEVAGWSIEVIETEAGVGTAAPAGSPIEDDAPHLMPVTLAPEHDDGAESSRSLGSELVFLGRGASCGVRVADPTVARVHALIVRGVSSVFAVDLVGSGLTCNERAVHGAVMIGDGDVLGLGRSRYRARVGRSSHHPLLRRPSSAVLYEGDAGLGAPMAGVESQGAALLAWVMRSVQVSQGEMLRRQGEQLREMVESALREQSTLLRESLDRVARIDRELAELREELRRSTVSPPLPALPPGPLRLPPIEPSEATDGRSTGWLLDRVRRLEEENQSTWRDLLGRLAPTLARAD